MTNISKYQFYCAGSRGSRPVEGHNFHEFGGYTTCYVLMKDDYALLIDCGTGFYGVTSMLSHCKKIDVIFTHMHYDHILGLLDWRKMPKNAEITCYGNFRKWFGEQTLNEFFKAPFWPISPQIHVEDCPADGVPLLFNDDLHVQFYTAPHPNESKMLIITCGEISEDHSNQMAYFCDCELSDSLPLSLFQNCNLLIYDGMYDDNEYKTRISWGHSTWQEACRLAKRTNCKRLIVTHHEPSRLDSDLRQYEKRARIMYPSTDFARAGQSWSFPFSDEKADSERTDATKSKNAFALRILDKIGRIKEKLQTLFSNRTKLMHFANIGSCAVLGTVSLLMTVVNYFTDKQLLMYSTLAFAVLSYLDLILILKIKTHDKLAMTLFQIEMVALFAFFLITGTPEGFSIIWIFLLPTLGLFVFGIPTGSILCAVMFAILIFFLDTSVGQSLCLYTYNDSFRLRFPMAFIAFYSLSLILELVRNMTLNAIDDLKANQDLLISKQTEELRDQNMELMEFNNQLEKRNQLLSRTFGRSIPDNVVEELLSNDGNSILESKKKVISALQCDIRCFTKISNGIGAPELVRMLNHYMNVMSDIIVRNNGMILSLLGDAIVAIFGVTADSTEHADDAVSAAIEMQIAMDKINEWNSYNQFPHIQIGIGVDSGETVIGMVGSKEHMEFDAVGLSMNNTRFVEQCSIGGQVLITEETKNLLHYPVTFNEWFPTLYRAGNQQLVLYSVERFERNKCLSCPVLKDVQLTLDHAITANFDLIKNGVTVRSPFSCKIIADSDIAFTIETDEPLDLFDTVRIDCGCGLMGKIVKKNGKRYLIRYSYSPTKFFGFGKCKCPESDQFFEFDK